MHGVRCVWVEVVAFFVVVGGVGNGACVLRCMLMTMMMILTILAQCHDPARDQETERESTPRKEKKMGTTRLGKRGGITNSWKKRVFYSRIMAVSRWVPKTSFL